MMYGSRPIQFTSLAIFSPRCGVQVVYQPGRWGLAGAKTRAQKRVVSAGPMQYGGVCMRRLALGALTLLGGACLPYEPYWLVSEARFLRFSATVVEPGGYSTLLNVPAGQRRATALPLDTIELEWFVATPPGETLPPPIWVLCSWECGSIFGDDPWPHVPECLDPLPFLPTTCRLGEGHRTRVTLAGAATIYSSAALERSVLVVGSRDPNVSPETCLERLVTRPSADLQPCLTGQRMLPLGPSWAFFAVPFSEGLSGYPPELLAEEADTHPDITAFRVTRVLGSRRTEVLAAPGDTVTVAPRERITVLPVTLPGQDYNRVEDYAEPVPDVVVNLTERIHVDAALTALVDDFSAPEYGSPDHQIRWTVPDHLEPATLYVTASDDRSGRAFATLQFVAEGPDDAP